MSSQYFQRNKGLPLLIKLGILVISVYLIFLLLKLFAVVLAAVFVVFKYLLLIALFGLLGALVVKLLFGIDLFPFGTRSKFRYPKRP